MQEKLSDTEKYIGKKVRYKDDLTTGVIVAVTYDEIDETVHIKTDFYGICGEDWDDLEFID